MIIAINFINIFDLFRVGSCLIGFSCLFKRFFEYLFLISEHSFSQSIKYQIHYQIMSSNSHLNNHQQGHQHPQVYIFISIIIIN